MPGRTRTLYTGPDLAGVPCLQKVLLKRNFGFSEYFKHHRTEAKICLFNKGLEKTSKIKMKSLKVTKLTDRDQAVTAKLETIEKIILYTHLSDNKL